MSKPSSRAVDTAMIVYQIKPFATFSSVPHALRADKLEWDAPTLLSNGSMGGGSIVSDVDAVGCLRSLRARMALDGVSWVQGGSVEIAVGQ